MMGRRRREKEIFRISKPRNRPTEKKVVQYGTRNNLCLEEETSLKQKVKENVKERNNILEIHFVFVRREGEKKKNEKEE